MNLYILTIILFVIWYALALVVSEKVGKNRKLGEEWTFFISMMLSPLVGYVIAIATPKK
jgi:hypothetical protein